jgi:archaellum component FlaC
MEMLMVRQGNDDDRLGALERAFVALHSELTAEMDRRFDRVDARLDRMEDRFDRVDEKFERVEERFERMHQLLIKVCASLIGTLIVTGGGLVATQL